MAHEQLFYGIVDLEYHGMWPKGMIIIDVHFLFLLRFESGMNNSNTFNYSKGEINLENSFITF